MPKDRGGLVGSFGCLLIKLSTRRQRVWRELNAGQITAKVLGTYMVAPQPPSASEVLPIYTRQCANTVQRKLEPEERPTAMQVLTELG